MNAVDEKKYENGFGKCDVRCIDVIRTLPFSLGSAVKHVWAADAASYKGHLSTAKWYIDDLLDNRIKFDPAPAAMAVWSLVSVCFDTEDRTVFAKWAVIEHLILFELEKASEALDKLLGMYEGR